MGAEDLLAAFGFECAVAAAAPGSRINDLSDEFLWAFAGERAGWGRSYPHLV